MADLNQIISRLENIKWKSVDKDNMEFQTTITCWTMDAFRQALEELHRLKDLND